MSVQLSTEDSSLPSAWPSSFPLTWGQGDGLSGSGHANLPSPCFVPRDLVHRAAVERVLVTDGVWHGPDSFIIAAMLPRDHCLYHCDDFGWADPMLAAEAFRQAGYYIQHRFYGVPQTHKFVLSALTLRIHAAPTPSRRQWLPVNLRVTCTPTARWTRRRLSMRLEVEFSVAGVVCGHGSLLSQAVDARMYQTIRGQAAGDERRESPPSVGCPLSPERVGRRRRQDVLLAEDGNAGGWLLRLDHDNPELLDHPVDHVPGMAMLEAFRQAALVASPPCTGRRPALAGLDAQFAKFCELGTPIRISAQPELSGPATDRRVVRIAAEQNGDEVAAGTIELGLVPDTSGRER